MQVRLWAFVRAALAQMGYKPDRYLQDRLHPRVRPLSVNPVSIAHGAQVARAVAWLADRLHRATQRLTGLDWLEPACPYAQAVCLTRSHSFSHARATRDLGYMPAVPLDEALRCAVGDSRPGTLAAAAAEPVGILRELGSVLAFLVGWSDDFGGLSLDHGSSQTGGGGVRFHEHVADEQGGEPQLREPPVPSGRAPTGTPGALWQQWSDEEDE
jgi:hypothetical protein